MTRCDTIRYNTLLYYTMLYFVNGTITMLHTWPEKKASATTSPPKIASDGFITTFAKFCCLFSNIRYLLVKD